MSTEGADRSLKKIQANLGVGFGSELGISKIPDSIDIDPCRGLPNEKGNPLTKQFNVQDG